MQYWLPDLQLTEADKELLLNPLGWLNDNHINAAQQLLKSNCSEISGFQDVTCGVALSFNVEPDEFIQILNNRNGHWLTVLLLAAHIQQWQCMTACIALQECMSKAK